MMKGGTPICSYTCGNYRAMLLKDPQGIGPIKYLHVLMVYQPIDGTPPILYITAEQNVMQAELLAMLPDDLKAEVGDTSTPKVFMGVFDKSGHRNLGASDEFAILDRFETKALAVMREHLGLTASVQVGRDSRKGDAFTDSKGCLSVIAVVSVAMITFIEIARAII
jgi:hypothetical protein